MAITLVSDPASASANCYADIAFSDAYFETRLHSQTAWIELSPEIQAAALVQATRTLDRLVDWTGSVASDTQPLAWPRNYVQQKDRAVGVYYDADAAAFPVFLAEVCCELAMSLAAAERFGDDETGLNSLRAGPIALDFDESDRTEIFNDHIVMLIGSTGTPKKRTPSTVRLVRA